jgi:hypothetical protein
VEEVLEWGLSGSLIRNWHGHEKEDGARESPGVCVDGILETRVCVR